MNNPRRLAKDLAHILYLVFIAIVLGLVLSGCNQKSNHDEVVISGGKLSAPLPSGLLAIDQGNLLVIVSIDSGDGSPLDAQICEHLSVDQINETFSCDIRLPPGAYTLLLGFFIDDSTFEVPVLVATSDLIEVEVSAGRQTRSGLSLGGYDYNIDDDDDGINNYTELDEGSNPNAPSYYIGGTVSNLLGSGAVIQLNGGNDLTLTGNGSFIFTPALDDNSTYTVTVATQPNNPAQNCAVVANGNGTVSAADITNVSIICDTVNTVPIANAGPDQTVRTGDTVTLDGSNSTDSDGDLLTYSWVITSFPAGSAAVLSNAAVVNPTFIADVAGTYEIRLVVSDGLADSNADFVSISTAVENKVVFATSVTGNGNFASWADAGGASGLAAADAICQARAETAGVAGTFIAWVSDANDDAYCRLHGLSGKKSANCGQTTLPVAAGPWVRTDGFPFSESIEQLLAIPLEYNQTNGVVYSPVGYDEFGNAILPETASRIYTGTWIEGALHPSYPIPCSNWSSNIGTEFGATGTTEGTTSSWGTNGATGCSANNRLLCFETGVGTSLPSFQQSGNVVFVTSVSGNGNLSSWSDAGGNSGTAAGNAICQARASAAGLANPSAFKAWLSNGTTDARDRIVSDGPWVRPDGVVVANDKIDLLDGVLFTGISQDEFGNYRGNNGVWTGTAGDGLRTSENCSDWGLGNNSVMGTEGRSSYTLEWWTNSSFSQSCDTTVMHLYCFEDIMQTLLGDSVSGKATHASPPDLAGVYNYFNDPITLSDPIFSVVSGTGIEFQHASTSLVESADFDANTLTIIFESLITSTNQHINFDFFFDEIDFGTGIIGLELVENTFPTAPTFDFGPRSIHVYVPGGVANEIPGGAIHTLQLRLISD